MPKGYLNEEEYKLYERLYGMPLRETLPEDVGMPVEGEFLTEDLEDSSKGILLRETVEGVVEEVEYYAESPPPPVDVQEAELESLSPKYVETIEDLPSEVGLSYISAVAKNQREYDALLKLQKDFERSSWQPIEDEEEIEEEEEEEEDIDDDGYEEEDEGEPGAMFRPERVHSYTRMSQWRTYPSTLHLPRVDFVNPITELLDRTDIKHVKETAEKAFGGPGLPNSVATPVFRRNGPQKGVGMEAGHHRMSEIEADAYIATNLPGMYASVMSILVEVRKRLGAEWMQNIITRNNGEGPRVLDVGAGGAGLAAWEQVLQAEWDLAREAGRQQEFEPPGKKTVVVGSENLRQRISRFLHNTTFLPRLPDYVHSGNNSENIDGGESSLPRKEFDIIIASHLLMPLKEGYKRKALIDNLWEMLSPEGGILIIMEKGHPRGFEAVADVRSRLLNEFIFTTPILEPRPESIELGGRREREREQGSIIAPCTNHKACPMYLIPGLSPGRKDFCRFSQRFIRPPFLQRVLGATHRNHEDVEFSFVAVQRGRDGRGSNYDDGDASVHERAFAGYEGATEMPDPRSLPRNVLRPLKRHGHVTLDLCTPAGTIERWTVPKSFSRQAYHDARKTRWGDLWALGAKTRVVRSVRLGRGVDAEAVAAVPNDGGVRSREAMEGLRGKGKPKVIHLNADSSGIYSASERVLKQRRGGRDTAPVERRTKGGKKMKLKNLLEELE